MIETNNIKKSIYDILNPIAPATLSNAPADNTSLPGIVYYFLLNEPFVKGGNSYDKNYKHCVVHISMYAKDENELNALKKEVEDGMTGGLKAVLQTENDTFETGSGVIGYYFEFEIYYNLI